jgi:hypothetical protein
LPIATSLRMTPEQIRHRELLLAVGHFEIPRALVSIMGIQKTCCWLSFFPLLGVCGLASLGAVGCDFGGVRAYEIHGTLKYEGTEETIPGARIEMRPEDPVDAGHRVSTVGRVQDDGAIVFTTFEPGDGAVEGRHLIILSEPPFPPGWDFDDRGGLPPPKIPEKYKDYATSDLRFDVSADADNRLDIIIERPGRN